MGKLKIFVNTVHGSTPLDSRVSGSSAVSEPLCFGQGTLLKIEMAL